MIKVQQALLIRDPGCLPVSGADGAFGGESAAAVHSFKVEELGVEESQVIDDVGPLTVRRLDEIARAAEVTSVAVFNQFGDTLANVASGWTTRARPVRDDGCARDREAVADLGGQLTFQPVTWQLRSGICWTVP